MKTLSAIIICMLTVTAINSQKAVDKFINKHVKEDHTTTLSFPGWMFEATLKLAAKMDDDGEFADYAKLAEHVKNIRLFVIEENNKIPEDAVQKLIKTMVDKEGYDEYIRIRSKGTNVNLFAIEENEAMKRLVFFIDDDDTFVMIRLKLDLPYSVFETLNYKLNDKLRP